MPEMDAIDIFGWLGYEIFLALFLGSLEDMESIYASAPAVRQSVIASVFLNLYHMELFKLALIKFRTCFCLVLMRILNSMYKHSNIEECQKMLIV